MRRPSRSANGAMRIDPIISPKNSAPMIIDRSNVLNDHWAPSSTPKKLPSAISNKLKNEPRPISKTILRCQPDSGSRSNRAAMKLGVCSPIEVADLALLLLAIAPPGSAGIRILRSGGPGRIVVFRFSGCGDALATMTLERAHVATADPHRCFLPAGNSAYRELRMPSVLLLVHRDGSPQMLRREVVHDRGIREASRSDTWRPPGAATPNLR